MGIKIAIASEFAASGKPENARIRAAHNVAESTS